MRSWWNTTFGLTMLVSLLLTVTTVVIGLGAYDVAHEALEVQLDHRIEAETKALLAEAGPLGAHKLAGVIRQRDASHSTARLGYILLDRDGKRIAGKLDAEIPAEPGFFELLPYDNGTRIAQALTTHLPDGERLVVAADRAVIDETDVTMAKLFGGALAVILALGIGATWTVRSFMRSRLRRIDTTAQAIIAGDLAQRIPVDGSDSEFDKVSATLNQMLDRIGGLLENLRQVSSDVAHDLRTPLTRLQNNLHDARTSADPAAQSHAIEAASAQAQELLDLFAALLRISEVEAGSLRDGFKSVSLSAIAEELVETYQPDAEISGHRLSSSIQPGLSLPGDARLLRQLIANLLDNALRHTPTGTAITLTLRSEAGGARLSVEDDGPGVSAADAERLFERFSRGERSRSTSGHGLGLALVAAVARIHNGAASIRAGQGFRIDIDLR